MRRIVAPIAALGALWLAGSAGPGTTWHVDVNGTPPGDGSPGNPYASIQHAIDQVTTVDGDTVLVAPGTYVETVDYKGKRLFVRSVAGPVETTILPPDPSAPWVVFMDSPWPGALLEQGTLEGFTVRRGGVPSGDMTGVRISLDEAYCVVRRCIVREHARGLAMGYTGTLEESTVTDCTSGVTGSGLILIDNSIVRGNQYDILNGPIGGYAPAQINHSAFGFVSQDVLWYQGSGNLLNEDPLFWDAANDDYRLRPDSPCIDAGYPGSPLDPDGSIIDMGALTYDPAHAPGTAGFCFGSDAECPCANGGSGDGGCEIAQGTGGYGLSVLNFTPDGAGGGSVDFLGTGYPPSSLPGVTLIRSPGAQDPPVLFGDGLRCIASTGLVRINATLASGGTSLQHVNHGAGAGTFFYQAWVRNNPSTFCTPAAFNLSNGVSITWP